MEQISHYFHTLTPGQVEQLAALQKIYTEWNSRINVISRKDVDNLYERHVLHSLAIAKFISFRHGTKIMDLGTGGGFPGIPLAILFPDCRFHLVDSIGKKLKVVEAAKEELGLKNVFAFHARSEQMDFKYDFVVSRAVAPLSQLLLWTKGKYQPKSINTKPNGLICLKGGTIDAEVSEAKIKRLELVPVSNYFPQPFFTDKLLVYVPA